jgi:hypothetical protein
VAWPVIAKQVGFLGGGGGKNAILQIYEKTPGQARLFQKQRRFNALVHTRLPLAKLPLAKLLHTTLLHTKPPDTKQAQKKSSP